jgi:hypothetical protein
MGSADLIAAVLASSPDDWMPHPKSATDSEPTETCEWPDKVEREAVDGKPSYYMDAFVLRADHDVMIGVGRVPAGRPPPKNYTREPWAMEGGLHFSSVSECEVHLLVKGEVLQRWNFAWLKEYRNLIPLPMQDPDGGHWVAAANVRFAETLLDLVRPGGSPYGTVVDLMREANVRVRDTGKKGGH